MAFLQWSEGLSVGVRELDLEHQRMIALINELFDALAEGRGREAINGILDGLVAYTRTHFAHEERLMAQHGFPGLETHRLEHGELTSGVLAMLARARSENNAALSLQLMAMLKRWLLEHINGTDKEYGPFLNGRGVQ